METTEVLDADTGELVPVAPTQITVFGTTDPQGIVDKAQAIAKVLVPIIEQRKLYKEISGRKHVYVEGWSNMVSMLGVFPHVISCVKLEREDEVAYEAKVELRTLNGNAVGAGEAICSSKERNWTGRDEFTIKSMAQTRAVGKACRLSFSWLIGLAGYEACPVEEMPVDMKPTVQMPKEKFAPAEKGMTEPLACSPTQITPVVEREAKEVEKVQKALGGMASDKQRKMIFAKCRTAGISEEILKAFLLEKWRIESTKDLSWKNIDEVLKWIDSYGPPGS